MSDVHLSNADAFTVHLEQDPLLRSTIVALAVLDRVPDWTRLVEGIDRATRLEPTFRRRLQPGSGPLLPARWVDDPSFDLSWHLRRIAVAAPGGFDQVLDFARISGMTAFDPARPRWEFTLVEGLADGSSVLVMKVHHTLTDGIGGIQLALHVVDLDRRGRARPTIVEPAAGASNDVLARAADAVTHDLTALGSLTRRAIGSIPGALLGWARRPVGIWEDVGSAAASVARFVRPVMSTMSPVMTHRRLGWQYRTVELPLEGLRAAARVADGTINDAFLAGVAGGLARYHREHGNRVEELRVTMPISTRTDDDHAGGNRVTLVRFTLPLGDHDPIDRMRAIDRSTTSWRTEPAIGWSQAIAGALNLLPTAVAGSMLKHVDVLASNVPGFDRPVFVAGARLDRFFAFGPTMGAAANITLMSYRKRCYVGINVDTGAVEDIERFVDCIEAGFAEVLGVGPKAPSTR